MMLKWLLAFLCSATCLVSPSVARAEIADEWYTPARFGMFFHWGLSVGGTGSTSLSGKTPPNYMTVEAFERDAPAPEIFAENLVGLTRRVGARYLILTLHHSCNGHLLIFPSKNEMYRHKTTRDYLGAVLAEAHRHDIKVVGYTSGGPHHWKTHDTVWLNGITGDPLDKDAWHSPENLNYYIQQQRLMLEETQQRYATIGGLDGLWIDGCLPYGNPPYNGFQMLREVFPNQVLIANNQHKFPFPEINVAAGEFPIQELCDPPYNRPLGFSRPREKWRASVQARNDYVEEIPCCNGWWYAGESRLGKPYREDPTFWVKQLVCSLGQRRKWNHAMGMAVKVDGTAPEESEPIIAAMERFMAWASPAIYDTVGGLGCPIYPGWMNGGAFGSVTVSQTEPGAYYLLVTQPPVENGWGTDFLLVQNDGIPGVESITDLRTGEPQPFELKGVLQINHIDWSDIDDYGCKIFKIVLNKPQTEAP